MLNLFSNLINAITGGTSNIFMKLLSMLGMGIFWKWFKGEEEKEEERLANAKLDADINKSNVEAGNNASEASKSAKINEEYLKQKRIINEMKLKSRVKIIVPDGIRVKQPFAILIEGIPTGTAVMMDDKWKMGSVNENGYLKMIVNTPGKRKISVTIGEHKFEKEIEIPAE
jgi:hypothetical protein